MRPTHGDLDCDVRRARARALGPPQEELFEAYTRETAHIAESVTLTLGSIDTARNAAQPQSASRHAHKGVVRVQAARWRYPG